MKHGVVVGLVVALALAQGAPGSPASEGPTRRESPAVVGPLGQQRVLEMVRFVEEKPFDPRAEGARAALMKYLIEAPDIEVTVHGEMLGDMKKLEGEHTALIVGQMMFAMGAYLIEHPQAKTNDVDVQLAGLEGALRVYRNVKALKPEARREPIEELVRLQESGKLAEHVKSVLARSRK